MMRATNEQNGYSTWIPEIDVINGKSKLKKYNEELNQRKPLALKTLAKK